MSRKKVVVTGIGGNVGQGILRNIRALQRDISIVGFNVEEISAGNHLCDVVYKLPYAYDKTYISEVLRICENEKPDLIIPSTDFESLYLSEKADLLPPIATSPFEVNRVFTDKYLTWEFFSKHNIPFAASVLPSVYKNNFKEIIVKPRQGRGSRGLCFNPPSTVGFSDDEYMVQELVKGTEITTAFYVKKNRELHGHLTLERRLENGTTSMCIVTHGYDEKVLPIINGIVRHLEIGGSCNIQSKVTAKGDIVPFEINGRISGTNSIRTNFGFCDVEYTIDEYLYNKEPRAVNITSGAAVRILMDVIFPGVKNESELAKGGLDHYIY